MPVNNEDFNQPKDDNCLLNLSKIYAEKIIKD